MYRHVHRDLFWGYQELGIDPGQPVYVALPEKALLDLVHLTPGKIRRPFLEELRLSPDRLDPDRLERLAKRTGKPKLIRAASLTARLLAEAEKEATP